jgi:hypothetical protein
LGNHYFPESSTVDLRQYAETKTPNEINHENNVGAIKQLTAGVGSVILGGVGLVCLGIGFLLFAGFIMFVLAVLFG